MTNNNKKAFCEAKKELQEEMINEIKDVMKSILQKIQEEKEKKAEAEENLRLLKLDMEDLRAGKIQKIKNRHEKSKRAKEVSPIENDFLKKMSVFSSSSTIWNTSAATAIPDTPIVNFNWRDATSGVYTVNCSNGTTKEFNL